jgi:hypothetical protein
VKRTCVLLIGVVFAAATASALASTRSAVGKPSAGAGVRASVLSTIHLPGGVNQVTYTGHPLYVYGAAPTATSYVGTKEFGGRWYAINAKGHAVK